MVVVGVGAAPETLGPVGPPGVALGHALAQALDRTASLMVGEGEPPLRPFSVSDLPPGPPGLLLSPWMGADAEVGPAVLEWS